MMNKLEAAARQALEALENHPGNYKLSKAECVKYNAVEAALREALAEQQAAEPVAGEVFKQFIEWASAAGFDVANTYDTDRSRWLCLNPMTADLWKAWQAAHGITASTIPAPQLEATQQAAEPNAVLVEGFGRVALGKLNDLREKGYAVNGVAIATISPDGKAEHGAVTVHGKVLWWPQQPAQQAAGPLSFNCSAGCGACGVKLQDFVTHQTQAQEGDEWVVVDAEPQIVSACCGSPVEVWDERKKDIVARVEAAQQQAQPTQQPLTDEQRRAIVVCFTSGKVSVSEVQRKLAIGYAESQTLCQSIVNMGLADGLQLCPTLTRPATHGITGSKEGGAT